MSNELLAKIKAQRQFKIKVGKFTFMARRPTDVEIVKITRDGAEWFEIATSFVNGWEAVTENDVVGGGGSDAVRFDERVWREWCADRPDFWQPIGTAVLKAYETHSERTAELEKNSQPGLS
jgi:hypothetical protein